MIASDPKALWDLGPTLGAIIDPTTEVVRADDPSANESITVHIPSEREKRHGQAVAAAHLLSLA